MTTHEIRRLLLDLTGTVKRVDRQRLDLLQSADWQRLQRLAAMHRLQPWLYWLHKEKSLVQPEIVATWQAAHRRSAMNALVQQAELVECVNLLRGDGFDVVALKGAYLASHAYPEPALRPMRDLDLILPGDQVVSAYETLRREGYELAEELILPIEESLVLDKHLPLMIAPRGTPIELHKRLSQPEGRLDLDAPHVDEAVLLERAMNADGISYPVAEDMLAHLIVHAIYGHRLDCGPLVLTDIQYLTRKHTIDWQAFWQRARREGWHGGAILLIGLVREFHGGSAIEQITDEPEPPMEAIRETAADLLLQNLNTRRSAKLLSTLKSGNFAVLWNRVVGRVTADGEQTASQDRKADGGYLRWAFAEAKSVISQLFDNEVRAQSQQLRTFGQWLKK